MKNAIFVLMLVALPAIAAETPKPEAPTLTASQSIALQALHDEEKALHDEEQSVEARWNAAKQKEQAVFVEFAQQHPGYTLDPVTNAVIKQEPPKPPAKAGAAKPAEKK